MRTLKTAAIVLACAAVIGCECDWNWATKPSGRSLAGRWTGTSAYPNAPFELVLTQDDVTLRGEYTDQLDRSIGVVGTFTDPTFAIVVDFGDAKLNFNGTLVSSRRAEGSMFTSALGNRLYPFTMTR